ncbi:DUF4054 domain-containing protein [Vibrio harveyi]|uniref:DUF4054 domain-containing protein n=1 Tax=Vibrio harveyi TaxID=669 RepID=UPI000C7D1C96|nr:DUF4054 domain-containing protein [Vibrio harveyi]AWB00244.1 DUF4054 domain-containing protein [Vibrio harveyi]
MSTIDLVFPEFRAVIPAYADTTTYPNDMLTAKWTEATCYISDQNYGRLPGRARKLAIQYMTAHLIYLGDLAKSGTPSTGLITQASEDGVSVSLTPPPNRSQFQYWLNLSPYGQSLLTLLSKAYVGGMYIGGSRERQGFRKYGGRF